jgi:hypothetical protein
VGVSGGGGSGANWEWSKLGMEQIGSGANRSSKSWEWGNGEWSELEHTMTAE